MPGSDPRGATANAIFGEQAQRIACDPFRRYRYHLYSRALTKEQEFI